MEFQTVVRRRRMVRSFEDRPLPEGALERVLDNAVRAPSAGFTQGWAFVVLEGRDQTELFWSRTLPAGERSQFSWPGLVKAPALVLALSHRDAYLARYSEADKARAGLAGSEVWPVPYWDTDCAFAVMLMLLTAVDLGLGALFFAVPRGEAEVLAALGVPEGYRAIGVVALGHPAADDRPSSSTARPRKPAGDVVHRGGW